MVGSSPASRLAAQFDLGFSGAMWKISSEGTTSMPPRRPSPPSLRLNPPSPHVSSSRLAVEDLAAFEFRYGMGLPVAGQYTGKLDDGGEQVRVSNILGTALIEFTYDNLAPWPVEAAGSGVSLVLTAPGVSPEHNDSSSWAASGVAGGTPGQENVISFCLQPGGAGDHHCRILARVGTLGQRAGLHRAPSFLATEPPPPPGAVPRQRRSMTGSL